MKDSFTKAWIIENAIDVLQNYEPGVLTIRALHYQLVSRGMTNDMQHYKRVVAATGDARWAGTISFDAFSDRERAVALYTQAEETFYVEKVEEAKTQIGLWMDVYHCNRWENQPNYVEVLIEKKALEGVFFKPCKRLGVGLGACKGYPSLTFLKDLAIRLDFACRGGKKPIILYFGDYDPSGEDIPRAISENLYKFGIRDLELRRICLNFEQVADWELPPAPTKITDSRSANWDGIGQVELDAVRPEKLEQLLEESVKDIFDDELYEQLMDREERERENYREELRTFVESL